MNRTCWTGFHASWFVLQKHDPHKRCICIHDCLQDSYVEYWMTACNTITTTNTFIGLKSTIPLAYWMIAPGAGQAFKQPGSAQCIQPSLRISHSKRSFSSTSLNASPSTLLHQDQLDCHKPQHIALTSERISFHSEQPTGAGLHPCWTSINFCDFDFMIFKLVVLVLN